MEITGRVIGGLTGTGILMVGLLYLGKPQAMAANFGLPTVPTEDAASWLRIKGLRDVATGLVAGVLIVAAAANVLGWAMVAFAVIPIGDATLILNAGGSRATALGIHGVTAALMLIGAFLLVAAS